MREVEVGTGAGWGWGRAADTASEETELAKCPGRRGPEVSARRPRGSWRPGSGSPGGRPGRGCRAWDGSLARRPSHPATQPKAPTPGAPLPSEPRVRRRRSRSFAQVPPPRPAPAARCASAAPGPGLRVLTWGRGPALPTAPSSSSARRSGPGAPAMARRSGLGHRCHLRNRARRLIPGGRRAAGEEPARGRPARGRGQAGSPAFLPHPAALPVPRPERPGSEPPTPAPPPRCRQLRTAKSPPTWSGYPRGNLGRRRAKDSSKVAPSLRPLPESVTLRLASDYTDRFTQRGYFPPFQNLFSFRALSPRQPRDSLGWGRREGQPVDGVLLERRDPGRFSHFCSPYGPCPESLGS